ncbi:MAG TPA: CoA transferase [Burkholderiales bacterium]|nr:CoA transferase [Burkholderiales bacterium]
MNDRLNPAGALPYAGVRVLDLSQGIAGPYCCALLAQQGAEVIKVEPPAGDWSRTIASARDGLSAHAIACNVGKRSVALDASKPGAREALLRLARRADVLVQNYRPGAIERMGLGYEALAAGSPQLVYLSITGFGPDGPEARKAGSDSVLQALTGIAYANRDADGVPRRVPFVLPDTATALYAAQAVGAALFAREREGRGRHIRISLLEACAAFLAGSILESALFPGHKAPLTVPSGVFRTQDGWIALVAVNDASFGAVLRALGLEAWLADERFATMQARQAHAASVNDEVAQRLAADTTAHWSERLAAHDALFAPVLDFEGLRAWPQARHAGVFLDFPQPPYGTVPLPRVPGQSHPHEEKPTSPAPRIGEHTLEVLREAGLSDEEMDRLRSSGAIGS